MHQNGQYGLASHWHHFVTFNHVETTPYLLNENEYLVAIVGKVHIRPAAVYPWEVQQESDTRDVTIVADQVKALFQKSKEEDKPFFLTVGFHDPHRDWTRGGFGSDQEYNPRISKSHYKLEDVEIPSFINDSPGACFELAEYHNSIHRLDLVSYVDILPTILDYTGHPE